MTGIVGYPLDHTLSPVMHNAAFRSTAVRGIYLKWVTLVDELEDFLDVVEGWVSRGSTSHSAQGVHNPAAGPVDPVAERIGAVNTVVKTTARWWDATPMSSAWRGRSNGTPWTSKGKRRWSWGPEALTLGPLVPDPQGADVDITNRTMGKAETLAKTFGAEAVTDRVAERSSTRS